MNWISGFTTSNLLHNEKKQGNVALAFTADANKFFVECGKGRAGRNKTVSDRLGKDLSDQSLSISRNFTQLVFLYIHLLTMEGDPPPLILEELQYVTLLPL